MQLEVSKIAEYKIACEKLLPEMRAAFQEHGWYNYSQFVRDDGMLVGYVETPDWYKANSGIEKEACHEQWLTTMKGFFKEDDMVLAEQVFYLP